MKKMKLFTLTTLLASLTLGAAVALNSKKAESTEASYLNPTNGVFVRIESDEELYVGLDVIIASESGYVLDDVWGNPAYVHGTKKGVSMSNEGKLISLENSDATIFHVEEGTEHTTLHDVPLGSYAFRADMMSVTGEKKANTYFGHNEKEDYSGESNYKNVGWFKDRDIAVQPSLKKESSWFVEFSTEEDDFGKEIPVTHIRNAKNVLGDEKSAGNPETELRFTHSYADRFVSDNGEYVYLYRAYDPSEYSISISHDPNKTDYEFGENINLDGLVITFNNILLQEIDEVSYSAHPNDFSFPETAYGSGDTIINCYYNGFVFTITINVTRPQYSVYPVGQLADYRGNYMLVSTSSFTPKGLDPTDLLNGTTLKYDGEHGRYYTESKDNYSNLTFDVTHDSSGYHVKTSSNYYLDLDTFSFTNTSTPSVLIEHSSIGVRIKNSSGQYLCYDSLETKKFYVGAYEEGNDVLLCKCPLSPDEDAALNTFGASLLDETNVCDPDGTIFTINSTTWDALEASFNALSDGAQASLVNFTYDVNNIPPGSIDLAISRYDYIYQKYHTVHAYIIDFMGRDAAGTMHTFFSSPNVSFVNSNVTNTASTVVIIVVALTSISSIGVLLVIKKRRAIR